MDTAFEDKDNIMQTPNGCAAIHVETLLTREEMAEAGGMSRKTIDRLVRDGRLPVIRVGRLVRFRPSAWADFAEKQKTAPIK